MPTITAETTTYDGHTYRRLSSAPEGVRWDDGSMWADPHHPTAFSTETRDGADDRGPGLSVYMKTEDRTQVDADGRWMVSYWVLA